MRHWLVPAMALLGLAACSGDSGTPDSPMGPAPSQVLSAGQTRAYVVVFQRGLAGAKAVSASLARQVGARERFTYERAIQGFAADLTDAQVQELRKDPRVQFIEPDQLYRTTATQTPTPSWGLDRIDQRNLPLNSAYTYSGTGAGVRFYGIDTGILYSHPDFGGRASFGFDAFGGNGADCNGHGTHTASTAAGATYGVAKGMTIIAVRVLDCTGSGTTSTVIAGVDWVTQHAIRPAVANMSLGGSFSSAINQAVANSIASGITYTVSAGNSAASACSFSPASTPAALTVGATTSSDARSSFSNFGTCLDLFAPGSGIRAAWIPSGSAVLSGTSMSAPHVAGVAGLYLEGNPAATPAQVASAIVTNATPNKVTGAGSGSPNRLLYMGFLSAPPPPPPPPPPGNQPPTAAVSVNCVSGGLCTFDGRASSDADGTIVRYEWRPGGATANVISTQALWSMTLSPRTRTWTLTVYDNAGASDVESFTFTALP
ncbi:MAG TPA: S8 family peptidase [Gemmatimonadales bacterium]|nr:S8 family peptidase [Gemmatimonadales bacterium]